MFLLDTDHIAILQWQTQPEFGQLTQRMGQHPITAIGEQAMQIPVLIEPVAGSGYRARGVEPFGFTVEAATPEEAMQKLREQIRDRIATGAKIVPLDVPPTEHPWAEFAGWLRDDPMLDAWKQAMAEYRRQRDEELDAS